MMNKIEIHVLSMSFFICVSGKKEILVFLRQCMPSCLSHLDEHAAYVKTRTQLFNRRKTQQAKLKACFAALSN